VGEAHRREEWRRQVGIVSRFARARCSGLPGCKCCPRAFEKWQGLSLISSRLVRPPGTRLPTLE
jgi:hypothetical protein